MTERCPWCLKDPLYVEYHDTEWGCPIHDDRLLFEFLILEGMQAGLSWLTILRKREGFRRAFAGFDPGQVARFGPQEISRLMLDPGIIRHRKKIEAAIHNARLFLELQERYGTFSSYIWRYTSRDSKVGRGAEPKTSGWHDRNVARIPEYGPSCDRPTDGSFASAPRPTFESREVYTNGEPIQNTWGMLNEVPCATHISDQMAQDLKEEGFQFVGTKICYSFMQAVGMVNDHLVSCFRHNELSGKPIVLLI